MVSPAVMGTGTVSNVSAKSVSRNSCSGSGSDFKKVMAASLAQNTAGAGKNPADNKLSVPIAEKSDAQTAKSSSLVDKLVNVTQTVADNMKNIATASHTT